MQFEINIIFQNETQNLVESIHFWKNYSLKFNTKFFEEIIYIFNNILQKVSSTKSFIWDSENDQKNNYIR
jgi:hypothetical protein